MYQCITLLVFLLSVVSGCAHDPAPVAPVADSSCHHLVLFGDPHLPGRNMPLKEAVRETVNAWPGVELVIALGDICEQNGTAAEYAQAREYFQGLRHPLRVITGNHDFIYDDISDEQGKGVRAPPQVGREKLRQFRETFGLSALSESRVLGKYLLVFVSAESTDFLVGLTPSQLAWLDGELTRHADLPTLIFFHAPLLGTLRQYKPWVNQPHSVAQPVDQIHALLEKHPQVFLWASGHTHTTPLEESYASAINLYGGRVHVIHNAAMNRETIWTNTLSLCADRVVVRTYDHRQGRWRPELERHIVLPAP